MAQRQNSDISQHSRLFEQLEYSFWDAKILPLCASLSPLSVSDSLEGSLPPDRVAPANRTGKNRDPGSGPGAYAMKAFAPFVLAAVFTVPAAFAQNNDAQLQQAVQKALHGSEFKGIQAAVQNGSVTLTGNVDVVAAKLSADQKAHHVKGVEAVNNEIQVGGPQIPDDQLQAKLNKAVTYDLWGNVPVQFQAISVQVNNGVATVGGHAAGPVAAADAVAVVANTKGVRDVVDEIQVDPVSDFDNEIRVREFRAIYGYPLLNQFAIDPQKPIRIQVANGHVTLYGTVDNQAQKDAAGIQANTVPGVFSVTNNLQVAGSSTERPSK
jgi:hyperosmotically inducible periplasmic protein